MESTGADRGIRWAQYRKADECRRTIGPRTDYGPLFLVELMPHTCDAVNDNHDRDHRSLICFAPTVLKTRNLCAVRVAPSCCFATHLTQSVVRSENGVVCLRIKITRD